MLGIILERLYSKSNKKIGSNLGKKYNSVQEMEKKSIKIGIM